jgi:hypothetical protein
MRKVNGLRISGAPRVGSWARQTSNIVPELVDTAFGSRESLAKQAYG